MSPHVSSCGRCGKSVVIAEGSEGIRLVLEEVERAYRLFTRAPADIAVRLACGVYVEHAPLCPGQAFPDEEAIL